MSADIPLMKLIFYFIPLWDRSFWPKWYRLSDEY